MYTYAQRRANAIAYLAQHGRDVFERFSTAGTGGKVRWHKMPADYDNRKCLPWSKVKGRYFYPWL